MRRLSRYVLRALLLATAVALFSGCGKKGLQSTHMESVTRYDMSQVDAELSQLEVPEGVAPELFETLVQALREALEEEAKRPSVGVSDNSPFQVRELTAVNKSDMPHMPPHWLLRWAYENGGDYNQDGIVSISDLTPLAVHFGETVDESGRWPSSESQQIDGNEDGTISIADVAPIAADFGHDVGYYKTQRASSISGPWETAGSTVPFELGSPHYGRILFEEGLWSGLTDRYRFFRVIAEPHRGYDYEPSEPIDIEALPPKILGVAPWSRQGGETATFTAFVGGAEPLSYSWDFGGGAEPNTSSEPSPTVTLGDLGEYEATVTLANAFGEAHYHFTLHIREPYWRVETVSLEYRGVDRPTTVAFAPDGKPTLAWGALRFVDWNLYASTIRFAYLEGTAWRYRDIDVGLGVASGDTLSLVYSGSGSAGLAYGRWRSGYRNSQLVFWWLIGDEWFLHQIPEAVDPRGCNSAFDSNGNPRVVYGREEGGLYLASYDDESWTIGTIEPPGVFTSPAQIAIDSLGTIHLMYRRGEPPGPFVLDLTYAYRNGDEWVFEKVAEDVPSFAFALTPDEKPVVAYTTSMYQNPYLAFRDEAHWNHRELPREPYLLSADSLAFLPSGEAVLALSDGLNLVVARENGEEWNVESIDSAAQYPEGNLTAVDVAVSPSGKIAVSYKIQYLEEDLLGYIGEQPSEESSLVKLASIQCM